MSSPSIDLDMNLDSPSSDDRHGIPVKPATDSSIVKRGIHLTLLNSDNAGEDLATKTNDAVSPEVLNPSQEVPSSPQESETLEEKELSAGNLEKLMECVESWKEEVNMMTVKNAILLDDLVKVGADV